MVRSTSQFLFARRIALWIICHVKPIDKLVFEKVVNENEKNVYARL